MDNINKIELYKNNRMNKTSNKRRKFYCGCDFNMIRLGGKCGVCGYRNKTTHKKYKGGKVIGDINE